MLEKATLVLAADTEDEEYSSEQVSVTATEAEVTPVERKDADAVVGP